MTNKKNDHKCLIFIINWQQCEETKELLTNTCFNRDRFDIFIFDNESTTITEKFFTENKSLYDHYKNSPTNLGFATPCNIGLDFADKHGYEFIFFLNNDVIISNNDAEIVLNETIYNKNVALASPLIKDIITHNTTFSGARLVKDPPLIEHISPNELQDNINTHNYLLYGTALMGRVKLLRDIGGFYEPFFAYWEDCLLSISLIDHGYACAVIKNANVFHKNDRSGELDTPQSQYYYYYLVRNEIIFWKKVIKNPIKPIYWLIQNKYKDCIYLLKISAYTQIMAILSGLFDGLMGIHGKWNKHIRKT